MAAGVFQMAKGNLVMDALIDTWYIHHRIHLYVLEALPEEAMGAIAASKGRTVDEQFAHIHNVRLMWLKSALPEALTNVEKIEKEGISKALLASALTASADAIALLLEKAQQEGRVKGFKPHPAGFLGYLISHESHHRGQIFLSLKQAGFPVDKKTAFGIWEWGVR